MIIRKQLFFVLLTLSPSISFKVASELFLRFFSSTRFDRGVARGGGVLGCRWPPLCRPSFEQTTYNIKVTKTPWQYHSKFIISTNPIPVLLLSLESQTVVFQPFGFHPRKFKKFIIRKVLLPQSYVNIGAKSNIFQLRILCEGQCREQNQAIQRRVSLSPIWSIFRIYKTRSLQLLPVLWYLI